MTAALQSIEDMIGDFLLHTGFTLMRWHEGLVCWGALEMACARRQMAYRWN